MGVENVVAIKDANARIFAFVGVGTGPLEQVATKFTGAVEAKKGG